MKVKDLMTRNVHVARPDDTLEAVASSLAQYDVGSLPVCDGERLLGMITDRDIVIRAVARGLSPGSTVGQIMSPHVEYCFETDDISEVCDRMAGSQIRRVPVVDADEKLVGIVSLGDLALGARAKSAGKTLEEISRPGHGH